jgi:hypothetical protein
MTESKNKSKKKNNLEARPYLKDAYEKAEKKEPKPITSGRSYDKNEALALINGTNGNSPVLIIIDELSNVDVDKLIEETLKRKQKGN